MIESYDLLLSQEKMSANMVFRCHFRHWKGRYRYVTKFWGMTTERCEGYKMNSMLMKWLRNSLFHRLATQDDWIEDMFPINQKIRQNPWLTSKERHIH